MKKLLILVIALCLGAFVWYFLFRKGENQMDTLNPANAPQKSSQTITPKKEDSALSSKVSGIIAGKYPRWEGGRSSGLSDPRWRILNQRETLDPAWRGKVEIEFFGKVVDEKNLPVEEASIKFSKGDLSPAGTTQLKALSDTNGLFSLTGVLGRGMIVTVEKTGYYTSKLNRYAFEYAEFSDKNFYQPDPNNPVIIRLRKKGQAEALVYRETLYGLKIDGTKQYLDLRTGKKLTGGSATGDLALNLTRSPSGNPNKFDWTLEISSLGAGGLVQSSDEFMFTAPDSGYKSSDIIRQQAGASDYERQITRNYYVRLADGKTYARLNAEVRPKYNDEGAIDITLYLNPSGSRNLEFDPTKAIKLQP